MTKPEKKPAKGAGRKPRTPEQEAKKRLFDVLFGPAEIERPKKRKKFPKKAPKIVVEEDDDGDS